MNKTSESSLIKRTIETDVAPCPRSSVELEARAVFSSKTRHPRWLATVDSAAFWTPNFVLCVSRVGSGLDRWRDWTGSQEGVQVLLFVWKRSAIAAGRLCHARLPGDKSGYGGVWCGPWQKKNGTTWPVYCRSTIVIFDFCRLFPERAVAIGCVTVARWHGCSSKSNI